MMDVEVKLSRLTAPRPRARSWLIPWCGRTMLLAIRTREIPTYSPLLFAFAHFKYELTAVVGTGSVTPGCLMTRIL